MDILATASDRRPYTLAGSDTGILCLHGFMGSPLSWRPIAEQLSASNFTAHVPLLPGHGKLPVHLANISHKRWINEAEHALDELRKQCSEIFVIGHSMGAALTAHLPAVNPDIQGVMLIAPLFTLPSRGLVMMPALRRVMPFMYPMRHGITDKQTVERRVLDFNPDVDVQSPEAQARLDDWAKLPTSALDELRKVTWYGRSCYRRIHQPTLILQGEQDEALKAADAHKLFKLLPTPQKQIEFFPNSRHELMRPSDPAHAQVWSLILSFIEKHRCQPTVVAA